MGEVDGLNLYGYVGGDPVSFVDSWGMDRICNLSFAWVAKVGKDPKRRGGALTPSPTAKTVGLLGGIAGGGTVAYGVIKGSAAAVKVGGGIITVAGAFMLYDMITDVQTIHTAVEKAYETQLTGMIISMISNIDYGGGAPRVAELNVAGQPFWKWAKYYCLRNDTMIVDILMRKGEKVYFERWECPCNDVCQSYVEERPD